MRTNKTVLVGLLCAAIPTLVHGQQATATERYALQERCGKQATVYFEKEYADRPKKQIVNFEDHYSAKLNKCFYLEVILFLDAGNSSLSFRLFDLNENKQYGSFFATNMKANDCAVGEAPCSSEKEWRQLAKPYLED